MEVKFEAILCNYDFGHTCQNQIIFEVCSISRCLSRDKTLFSSLSLYSSYRQIRFNKPNFQVKILLSSLGLYRNRKIKPISSENLQSLEIHYNVMMMMMYIVRGTSGSAVRIIVNRVEVAS